MQEVWTKALARRETDPEGAVTSARTLLESLCKHILDSANQSYRDGAPLPELYKRASAVLEIAPTEDTAPIFTSLFTACAEIVKSIGVLRNHLSDAHGRGPFGTMPDWRHAELAVNLSGAMATYLAAVWKGRQPTVGDVIREFLKKPRPDKPMGTSQRYTLEMLARSPIGEVVASKLQISDIIAHCEERVRNGISPATTQQDFTFLRVALGESRDQLFNDATLALRSMQLIKKSVPRTRRVAHEEFDAIISFFREREKNPKTKVEMADVLEFAVWSGRRIGDIVKIRWSDLDLQNQTCREPGKKKRTFPLLENAWKIVTTRPRKDPNDPDERIFPYERQTVISNHVEAKHKLSKTMPAVADLRLNDYRFEAVNRLLEKGHPPHMVARASGMDVSKVVEIHDESRKGS
jgi:integrase